MARPWFCKSARDAGETERYRLLRAATHRGWVARQLDPLGGVGEVVLLDPQDPQIPVEEIADIDILPVGAERDGFRQRADIDLADIGDFLAVDFKGSDGAGRVIEGGGLRHVRAARLD